VPATAFIATGFIGTNFWMWAYEIEEMVLRYTPAALARAARNAHIAALCSRGLSRRMTALACAEYLKRIADKEREEVMMYLRRALPVEVDDENRFLSWDEVRQLRSCGVDIGAHTVTHPLLTRISLQQAERQMVESRETLARELGETPTLFAYPNGDSSPEIR